MILLSRLLKPVANRRANLLVGGLLAAVNAATLLVGTPASAYAFLTSVMILTGIAIVWTAFTWVAPAALESAPVLGGGRLPGQPAVDAPA